MIDSILPRLGGVRKTGNNRWIARCPSHNDTSPSLAIRLLDDERILLHCFAGCDINSILENLDLTLIDLFPKESSVHRYPSVKNPVNAIDVLRCVSHEAHLIAVAASNLAQGVSLSRNDQDRLLLASSRLLRAIEFAE